MVTASQVTLFLMRDVAHGPTGGRDFDVSHSSHHPGVMWVRCVAWTMDLINGAADFSEQNADGVIQDNLSVDPVSFSFRETIPLTIATAPDIRSPYRSHENEAEQSCLCSSLRVDACRSGPSA